VKLTEKNILTLPANDGGDKHYPDPETQGLFIRVQRRPTGVIKRTFRAIPGSGPRKTLGNVGELPLADARKEAARYLAKVRLGENPIREEREKRAAEKAERERLAKRIATSAAIEMFLTIKETKLRKGRKMRPKSLHELRRYLRVEAAPLHGKVLEDVVKDDIRALIGAVEAKSVHTAGRLHAALNGFFSWCVIADKRATNPVIGVEVPDQPGPRKRVLSDGELAEVWQAAGDGTSYGKIIRLLILSGCRRAEIGGLHWREVDLEARQINLPGERTKNWTDFVLPLSDLAISLLPEPGGGYVFGNFTAFSIHKAELDRRISANRHAAGIEQELAGWTHHDLRRTLATRLGDLGVSPWTIECLLNHVGGFRSGVAGVYNHSKYQKEMREAVDLWSGYVAGLVSGDIVPMRKAG
jgi:integrase